MLQVLPLNVGLDHFESPSPAAAVEHSLSPVAASEKLPSPRAEQTSPCSPASHPARARGAPGTYLAPPAAGGGQQRSPTAATAAPSPPRAGPGACAQVQPGGLPGCASQSRRSPSPHRERLAPPAARGSARPHPRRHAAAPQPGPQLRAASSPPGRPPAASRDGRPSHPAPRWRRPLAPPVARRRTTANCIGPERAKPPKTPERRRRSGSQLRPPHLLRPGSPGRGSPPPSSPRGQGEGPSGFRARPPRPSEALRTPMLLKEQKWGSQENGETPKGTQNEVRPWRREVVASGILSAERVNGTKIRVKLGARVVSVKSWVQSPGRTHRAHT